MLKEKRLNYLMNGIRKEEMGRAKECRIRDSTPFNKENVGVEG